jgi:hypothetical protein
VSTLVLNDEANYKDSFKVKILQFFNEHDDQQAEKSPSSSLVKLKKTRLKIVPVLTREPIATLVAQWVSFCFVVDVQINCFYMKLYLLSNT